MLLKSLYLKNFRSYREAEFSFSKGINLIHGKNGEGKTNLLEAIYLFSTGRSFRQAKFQDLIQHNQTYFYIEAEFEKDQVHQTLKIGFDKNKRKITYNRTELPSLSHLLGILPSVLYSPSDISLVSGTPTERRRFLNIQIAQTDPLYIHHLRCYHKAMKQRNHLLKNRQTTSIESWEAQMAHSAVYLIEKRQDRLKSLHDVALNYQEEPLAIKYRPSLSSNVAEEIAGAYKQHREKELMYGSSLIGPHRDDFLLMSDQKAAKTFSSEGQKRSLISAIKFSEYHLLKSLTGQSPLLGIDDFGLHLDPIRMSQKHLMLKEFSQVFLTSPYFSDDLEFSKCIEIKKDPFSQ